MVTTAIQGISGAGLAVSSSGVAYMGGDRVLWVAAIDRPSSGFTAWGNPSTSALTDGPVNSAHLGYAIGIVVDNAGNLYFADSYNAAIRKVSPAN